MTEKTIAQIRKEIEEAAKKTDSGYIVDLCLNEILKIIEDLIKRVEKLEGA